MSENQIYRAAQREFPKGIAPDEVARRCERLDIAADPPKVEEIASGVNQNVMYGHLPARRRVPLVEWVVPFADVRFVFNDSSELVSMSVKKGAIGP